MSVKGIIVVFLYHHNQLFAILGKTQSGVVLARVVDLFGQLIAVSDAFYRVLFQPGNRLVDQVNILFSMD